MSRSPNSWILEAVLALLMAVASVGRVNSRTDHTLLCRCVCAEFCKHVCADTFGEM